MKKILAAVAIVILALSAWLAHSRPKVRREAAHQAMLVPYQRDLRIGVTRADVDRYLASKNAPYFTELGESPGDGVFYEVSRIEEAGDGWACDRWTVSVALRFSPVAGSREVAQPSDILKEIRIRQIGHCL